MEPLTPADCELTDFPFMPLHVARLRDSDLAAYIEPEACWYAVLLWAASWHQIPAASLPDDDRVLAKLCGLGRDIATFQKVRDGALHGFVKCSDGRLYHPVVAEQANEAWARKRGYRERKDKRVEAAKKAADQAGEEASAEVEGEGDDDDEDEDSVRLVAFPRREIPTRVVLLTRPFLPLLSPSHSLQRVFRTSLTRLVR